MQFQAQKNSSFGKFNLQASYQNTDTNLLSPRNNPVYFLPTKLISLQGLKGLPKSIKLVIELILYNLKGRDEKESLRLSLNKVSHSFDAQAASVLSRAELVVGAKLSNKVNKELFELNKNIH